MLLAVWVGAFVMGLTVAFACTRWVCLIVVGLSLAAAVWRLARRGRVVAVACVVLAVGVGVGQRALPAASTPLRDPEPTPSRVRGRVTRGPEPDGHGRALSHWRLEVMAVDGRSASGTLLLTTVAAAGGVICEVGDVVSFVAPLRVPVGLANPGLPDARIALLAEGITWTAMVSSPQAIQIEQRAGPFDLRHWAARMRSALARQIDREMGTAEAAFLRTLALGERVAVDDQVEDGFRAAGATHVLSVSGLHLAAVAAAIFFLAKWTAGWVPWLALRVPPRRIAAAVALPAVVLYTLLTGEAVATERSALMAAVVLGAELCGRPVSLAASIAVAAALLLARSPLVLADVSFQLSFASVVALALFARRLSPAPVARDATFVHRAAGWLGRFGAASVAAGLMTAPLVAHHFGEFTPAAPFGNLALVPLIELLILPLALGGALLGWAHPWAGWVPLAAAAWGAKAALWIAERFRQLAPVVLMPFPSFWETAALLAGIGVLLASVGLGRAARRWRWCGAGLLSLALLGFGLRELERWSDENVRITFLDVGQGDAAVVEGPRGFVAVIDGGGTYDESFDTGARVLEPYLRARGIMKVDLAILSHPHPDHMNGLFRLIERFPVETFWSSGDDGHNPRYRALLDLVHRRGVADPVPSSVVRHGLALRAIGPWLGDQIGPPPGISVNDASLVVRLSVGGRSALFPGDIEADGETDLVGRTEPGVPLVSDVLKVPHHGSRTSSSGEFLDVVKPRLAVMSLGRHNRFHFPRREVVTRYAARKVAVLRTDEVGAVTVTLSQDGTISASCMRGCE